jgi:hypothetical protein
MSGVDDVDGSHTGAMEDGSNEAGEVTVGVADRECVLVAGEQCVDELRAPDASVELRQDRGREIQAPGADEVADELAALGRR